MSKYRVFSGLYLSAFGMNTVRYLSVFNPNAGNMDQEKLRIWTIFTQWLFWILWVNYFFLWWWWMLIVFYWIFRFTRDPLANWLSLTLHKYLAFSYVAFLRTHFLEISLPHTLANTLSVEDLSRAGFNDGSGGVCFV